MEINSRSLAPASSASSRCLEWRTVFVVVFAGLILGSIGLIFPFGRDQGSYAYTAWAWLKGAMPYRDVYVFKPPGTIWVHALAQILFGHSMTAIRILDIGWSIATGLLLAGVTRRLFTNALAAPLAGVLYIFLYDNFNYWDTCQTDGWLNLPLVAAVFLITGVSAQTFPHSRSRHNFGLLFAAGFLVGIAMAFKYTAAAMLAPIGVLLLADLRAFPRRFAAVISGVVASLVIWLGWIWLGGAMNGFINSQVGLVPDYIKLAGRSNSIWGGVGLFFIRLIKKYSLRFVLGALVAGIVSIIWRLCSRKSDERLAASTVLAWLFAGAVACIAQNKFFPYHYLMMFPAAAMLGALAAGDLLLRLRRFGVFIGVLAAVILLAISPYPDRWRTLGHIATGETSLTKHWNGYRNKSMSVSDNLTTAAYIASATKPEDRVFIWGFDPMVNFIARRMTVSRFLYNYPFAVNWGNPSYKTELLAALEAAPPALFLVGSKDALPSVTKNDVSSRELFTNFKELKDFVETHYGPPKVVTRFDVYRRLK
jgi:hypothetical protein